MEVFNSVREDEKGNLILDDGRIPEKERMRAEIYSRPVGYLRPVENYSDAKQAEFHDRKVYKPNYK